ncbi:MAG: hypothetical protein MHM6MM_007814 [Cercozoa sp. M6MM]
MSDEEHTAPPEGEEQASGLPPRTDMTFVYAVLGVAAVILLSLAVPYLDTPECVVGWQIDLGWCSGVQASGVVEAQQDVACDAFCHGGSWHQE